MLKCLSTVCLYGGQICGNQNSTYYLTIDNARFPSVTSVAPEPAPEGVRRSNRTRIAPLEWYKLERPKYKRKSGMCIVYLRTECSLLLLNCNMENSSPSDHHIRTLSFQLWYLAHGFKLFIITTPLHYVSGGFLVDGVIPPVLEEEETKPNVPKKKRKGKKT